MPCWRWLNLCQSSLTALSERIVGQTELIQRPPSLSIGVTPPLHSLTPNRGLPILNGCNGLLTPVESIPIGWHHGKAFFSNRVGVFVITIGNAAFYAFLSFFVIRAEVLSRGRLVDVKSPLHSLTQGELPRQSSMSNGLLGARLNTARSPSEGEHRRLASDFRKLPMLCGALLLSVLPARIGIRRGLPPLTWLYHGSRAFAATSASLQLSFPQLDRNSQSRRTAC